MYEVKQSKQNIAIKTTKNLGLIGVYSMRITKLQSDKCVECSASCSECVRCQAETAVLWSHR